MHRAWLYVLEFVAVAASAQTIPLPKKAVVRPVAGTAANSAAEKTVTLPMRRVSLYKNGVGFFGQSGAVSGNELLRLDFTTAQLNDALQSLVAVDSGDGKISGAEYDSPAPLAGQIALLAPNLGPDPTMLEFFRAMKGAKVEVHSGSTVVSGRLFNVEVLPVAGIHGVAGVERRSVSIVTEGGGMRAFELTPSVELRLVGPEHQEVGHYLQLLSTVHNPTSRHLTLEDRGTGERQVQVSYLSAVPAWKSSYRILFNDDAKGKATLQGWAMVDNTSATDWDDVQVTLVSGAPQSFIQQISRPFHVDRPEVAMPLPGVHAQQPASLRGVAGGLNARFDPVSQGDGQASVSSAPISAKSIGGGVGMEIAQVAPVSATAVRDDQFEGAAKRSMTPQVSSVALDDLFEYKLGKPITIRSNQSAMIPLLETEVDAERVTIWNPREFPGEPRRALWIKNTSNLTLDRGSFSAVEAGIFGGEGQLDLLHPNEKKLAAYGVDEAISVDFKEDKAPSPIAGHVLLTNGKLVVHREYLRVRQYTIHNTGSSPRTVVLEPERTDTFRMESGKPRIATPWHLAPETPAPADMTAKEYLFEVQVAPGATSDFRLVEAHTHPTSYQVAELHEDEQRGILKEVKDNPDLVAKLQPLLDSKHRIAELNKELKANQRAVDAVKAEEKRIRENMAALTGQSGEQALSKRYADEMNEQEDKIAGLHKEKDSLLTQQSTIQKELQDNVASLSFDTSLRAQS
jgi:Domain of unknown function (DUF4139)